MTVHLDPSDPQLASNPAPLLNRLREEAPLYYNEAEDFFAVSRFDDVTAVLQDSETYSSAKGNVLAIIRADIEIPPAVLIFADPPQHGIYRKLLSRMFTPKRIMALEPRIRQFTVDVLDELVGVGEFDVIERVSGQIPMMAIAMLIGIPEEEQEWMRDSVNAAIAGDSGNGVSGDGLAGATSMFMKFVDAREANPTDDILGQLLTSEFTDEKGERRTLTKEEVCTYITLLAGAGNETTGRLIGWAAKYWSDHPDVRAELIAEPGLIPNALEEILRLEPPANIIGRYVTKDAELYGRTITQGSVMFAMAGAANRDPRRYENPETYDIHRQDIQHLTFGGGVHFCMGNALARLEGRVVMEEFLRRFPSYTVNEDGARMADTIDLRGWATLPIVPD